MLKLIVSRLHVATIIIEPSYLIPSVIFLSQSAELAITFFITCLHTSHLQSASLNVQLRSGGLSEVLLVWSKQLLHGATSAAVSLDNLDTTADIQLGLHHAVKFVPDGLEVLSVANALDQVIRLALDTTCD